MNKRQRKKQCKKFIDFVNLNAIDYMATQFTQHSRSIDKARVNLTFAASRMKRDFNSIYRQGGIK